MFKFIKNLLGIGAQESVKDIVTPQAPYKIEPPTEVVVTRILAPESSPDVVVTPVVAKRAKDTKGRFKADDPSTSDVNEAWKGGKAPAKKTKPKVTEGKTKGGNGAVKKPKANSPKPKAPAKPKTKK